MVEYYDKSIEELTGEYLGEPKFKSYVVITSTKAVKKPIKDLTTEEIRLLIGQRLGVKYLLHRAVLIVEKDPLICASLYEGDLMHVLLELEPEEWAENELDYSLFKRIVSKHKAELLETLISPELMEKY